MKKVTSVMLSLFMVLQVLVPLSAFAETTTTITVGSVTDYAGEVVEVPITIEGNPGILGATLSVSYDSGITLVDAVKGDAFSTLTMTKPGKYVSPCNFVWDGQDIADEDIVDGTVLTLSFEIDADAASGSKYDIKVSYDDGDIVDKDLNPVDVTLVDGCITVVDYTPGDLNDDQKVNSTDVIMLRRHIAGGYELTINEAAADVNADNKRNSTDVILIRRYIAGGYDVELKPSTSTGSKCNHSMTAYEYKAPTCTESGNNAYWYCAACDKYFTDENGTTQTEQQYLTIAATGHTIVIDEAVAPTYESAGLTEGRHCSVCGTIIEEQVVIPALQKDEYSIIYHIGDNDTYLMSLGIENPNPLIYTAQDGLVLKNLNVPGYNFMGWFTQSEGGTQVTEIPVGTTGDMELYAQWTQKTYSIQYESDLMPITDSDYKTYTAGVEKTLPKPFLDKYTFVGWSDANGNMWDKIPAGTIGDIILYANWASNRNLAVPVNKLGEPEIIEDTENGLILFTYEIGKIINVPLYTTLDIVCANGIFTEIKRTETDIISETNAQTVAESISNATTNSLSWALSNNWSDTTQVTQEYAEEKGLTTEEAETLAKTSSGTYSLTQSNGGAVSDVSTSSSTYRKSNNEEHFRGYDDTYESGSELVTNVSAEVSAEVGVGYGPVSAKVGTKLGSEVTDTQTENMTIQNTGTDYWQESTDYSDSQSNVSTASKTWNSTSGYSQSNSTSESTTVSKAVSEVVSNKWGYGSSYTTGGENEEAQAFAKTAQESEEYSSTFTYYNSHIDSTEITYATTGYTNGNYREVMAGTVHVFAVVCYDVATSEYYVTTYNVLGDGSHDDAPKEYLDYSKDTTTFDDYETSVLPFEVPYFVNDYVNSRIAKTNTLKVDADTGIVEGYTPNEESPSKVVVIPAYVSVDNGDGTFSAVKVTGIKKEVFAGKTDIEVVKLSNFITEIPDNAFEGCTSLKYVITPGVTKIGDYAFKDCTSLEPFTVPAEVTELGENAFENVPAVKVAASTADIAIAAASTDADSVTLDISTIPSSESNDIAIEVGEITYFELQGKDKEYKGLSLKSDAETTVVNGVTFTENTKIPMELSSTNVTLNRVAVDCSGYAIVLGADETNISLNRTVNIISDSGNAIVSKSVVFNELNSDVVGKLTITGNMLVCGEVTDNGLLTFTEGEIIYLTEEEYNNYITSHYIYFDANDGSVALENKLASMNMAIGELPIPRRDFYTFDGWYTEQNEDTEWDAVDSVELLGEKITEETLMTSLTDFTVYAHWIHNDLSEWTLAEEVPEDAEIVDQYWTYTLTSYTTSGSSTLSGWTKYDESWVWGEYGAWSSWSTTNPGESESRQREWSQGSNWVDTSYNLHEYHYYAWTTRYNYVYTTKSYASSTGTGTPLLNEIWITYELPWAKYSGGMDHYTGPAGNYGTTYYFKADGTAGGLSPYERDTWISQGYTNYYDLWRYRDRSKVWTYYFTKDEDKEASTYPEGDNISNIQEWVQYRDK